MIATKSIEDMKKKNNKAILNVYHMYQGKNERKTCTFHNPKETWSKANPTVIKLKNQQAWNTNNAL